MLITASRQPATSSPKPSHCSANGPSRTRLCSSRLLAEATTEREGNLLFHVLLEAKCLPEIRQSPIRDCGRMTRHSEAEARMPQLRSERTKNRAVPNSYR